MPPVVTKHEINAGARTLKYTVTTGLMPIRNQQGETEANIFFVASKAVKDKIQKKDLTASLPYSILKIY